MQNAKEKLQNILHGEMDFYFRFMQINVYKNGALQMKYTEDANSTFRRGGLAGGIVAQLDIDDDDTWEMIQKQGAFVGMYSGFDLFLNPGGWREQTNTSLEYAISYPIFANGIDYLILSTKDDSISLLITSGQLTLELTSIMNFY